MALFMIDTYTLRKLAMFLYPLYAVFFYKYYRWHKAWVAIPLAIFLVWHIPYPNYYNKMFLMDKVVQSYKERKTQESHICRYVWENVIPTYGREIHPSVGSCDDRCKAGDVTFRLLIWEDMLNEMIKNKAIFGMGLSHPLRSHQLEMLNWAEQEWGRDGWISAHNSYLYVVYRIGILGVVAIVWLFWLLYHKFIQANTVEIILFCCISYWLLLACWSEQFQLPYHAIPMWVAIGIFLKK